MLVLLILQHHPASRSLAPHRRGSLTASVQSFAMMVYRLGHSSRISLRTVACCLVGIVAVFLIALPPWTVCSATSTEESPSLADTSEQSNTKYRVSFYSTRLTPEVRYLEERSLLLVGVACSLLLDRTTSPVHPHALDRSCLATCADARR